MRIQLTWMFGVLALAAAAMLVAAAGGTSAASASEWKTREFPVEFLGEGLGLSTLLSEHLASVTCEHSHTKGSVESATLAKVIIIYLTNCELNAESPIKFKEACPTITTKELDVKPLSKLNGGTKTGMLVTPVSGAFAEFTCTGSNKIQVIVKGSVIGESTPVGKLVIESEIIYKKGPTHGSQEFTTGTLPGGQSVTAGLTAESTLGIFKISEKDSLETTRDLTYNVAVEQTP
jgi:hypothetical protein